MVVARGRALASTTAMDLGALSTLRRTDSKLEGPFCRDEASVDEAEELAAATKTFLVEVVGGKVVHVRPPRRSPVPQTRGALG
jgi:hypothetical protein